MGIRTINPATGEVVKTFQALSEHEIEKKLQLAVSAFQAERKTPFAVRAKRMLKESGYHGDKVQDEGLVKKMVKPGARWQ